MLPLANKGRGVHLLKTGSKRRRTQAEMAEQLSGEQFFQRVAEESESKVKDQRRSIANLEGRLLQLDQQASEDKNAADFIRHWLAEGKVVLDEQGVPNIIGNREEMDEPSQAAVPD